MAPLALEGEVRGTLPGFRKIADRATIAGLPLLLGPRPEEEPSLPVGREPESET
jgi:hypothetical protein